MSTDAETLRRRAETARRLRAGVGVLSTVTLQRLDQRLPWYRSMSSSDRSWVGLLAQSGISSFIDWYRKPDTNLRVVSDIFKTAPRDLIRSISLQQTLQLLKVVVEVVEERVPDIARSAEQPALREAVLIYSREIAFSAADIYARAAEARGSWDARLEAMVVDALVRGDSVDELASRTAAFGWQSEGPVSVIVGRAPQRSAKKGLDVIRRKARRWADDALVGIHENRLLIVLGAVADLDAAVEELSDCFGPSEVILGPSVPTLAEAATSARAAIRALKAATARPDSPRPVRADELLPERALSGDQVALRELIRRYYEPLTSGTGQLLKTVSAYVEFGSSLEATAKALSVHPNTVRYRLRKITEVIGLDPTLSRDAFVIHISLVYGRLSEEGLLSNSDKTQ
ncbi:PucR family transcriptional regulator [Brevibacterium sp. GP-SGM9]|uniref:PucR family transcriptional regulator n=1 Tax=unclassified Brevibacterium TaxID=2614124 RepID=UPI001E4356C8|nr:MULTISPECIES: helix-turn-helix domain-containing protein [unclassified Brevibacterium]MCD1284770.1 PucR family transcriptional regulator [Brevibacterium sp. CCUG 69071]MDK8435609.1 helix-turn-helix domain-containing protein [Brevibacterium sp. H-BE7]